jgi:signal transduction histidine kinase
VRRALLLGNVCVLLLVGLASSASLWQSREQFRMRALDSAHGQVHALAEALRARIERFDAALLAVASGAAEPEVQTTQLRQIRRVLPLLDQLHVTLSDGSLLPQPGHDAPLSSSRDRADLLQRVRAAHNGELVWSEPVQATDGSGWLILLARALGTASGPAAVTGAEPTAAMVHVELRTSVLQELFSHSELGAQGAITLRTNTLGMVARHVGESPAQQPAGVGTRQVSDELRAALKVQPEAGQYVAVVAQDGVERAIAYQRVGKHPLLLLVGLGTSDVLQPWGRHASLVAALLGGSALLLASLSWGLYGAIARATTAGAGLDAARNFLTRTERIAAVGGWELDLRSGRLRCTPEAAHIMGCLPGQRLSLKQALARWTPATRRELRRHALALLRGKTGAPSWDLQLPLDNLAVAAGLPPAVSLRYVRIVAEVEREAGCPVRLAGALQDVSEQHERKLALAREQALRQQSEEQVRALDELLRERRELQDVLAHEVRQPLNNASAALQGAAAALAGTSSAAAALPVSRAQKVLGQVIASIDNTLAVASLLAGSGPIDRADADLDTLLAVAIGDLPASERSQVKVLRNTAVRTASLDMGLMRLALRNLLANALQYGVPGAPVTLRLGDSDEPLGLTLDVENLAVGPQGVAPGLVPRLFDRGSRGRRDRPGHGLGLYIVHRVMELHHGRAELLHNADGRVVMRLLLLADLQDGDVGAPPAA